LAEGETQSLSTQPGHDDVRPVETRRGQQRIVRPPLESHLDIVFADCDIRRGIDEVAE